MIKEEIIIRKAEFSDISKLEIIFLQTRRDTFYWENPDKFNLGDLKKHSEGETIFLAENKDKKILGFISVWEHDTPAFIHHFFILPDYQRKGVGSMLIESLFQWLNLPYRLKCLTRNEKAIAYYLKNEWYALEEGQSEEGDYLLLELAKR